MDMKKEVLQKLILIKHNLLYLFILNNQKHLAQTIKPVGFKLLSADVVSCDSHEKEFNDSEERGIQFSFTRPFTKGEQLFSVPSSKIILKVFNNSSMQLIIHEILTEGRVRLDLEMKLSGKNNVNLNSIKEYFDNYC